ncbi:MAG: phosphatidylserine decarboxylase family protein [Magnetococcus sp. DMHC-6]
MAFRSPVAVEGLPFIFAFIVVAAVGDWLCPSAPGDALLWLLVIWCIWFFRDPERVIPEDSKEIIIAPADGVIIAIEEIDAAPLSGEPARLCSIFMNVFNVHVNRCPEAGRVMKVKHHAGKFFNAALDKSSTENERTEILLKLDSGTLIPFVQVAGLIARRIICRLQPGDQVVRGERFGLIRFGSRVDLYLPRSAQLNVTLGQKTKAGETIIAMLDTTDA